MYTVPPPLVVGFALFLSISLSVLSPSISFLLSIALCSLPLFLFTLNSFIALFLYLSLTLLSTSISFNALYRSLFFTSLSLLRYFMN